MRRFWHSPCGRVWTSLVALCAFSAAGCLQQVSTGPADPGSTAAGSDAGPPAPQPMGTGCGTDPQTGVTLCSGVDTCPGVTIDPAAWPNCGFRLGAGTSLDLECLCANALCPIGVATSCAQATQLLTAQNELSVCQQVSESRCTMVVAPPDGGGVPSSCDRNCEIGCGTAPDCLQICGC